MPHPFRIIASVRWPIVFLLAPILWSLSRLDGSGGWLALATSALLVLFWGLLNDASLLQRAISPRFGLSWDKSDWSLDTAVGLRTLVGALALPAVLGLLIITPAIGIWALAAWVGLVGLCWLESRLDGRNRYWLSEVLVPLAAVVLPTLVIARAATIASRAAAETDSAAGEALASALVRTVLLERPDLALLALLTAISLGLLVLLCLVRDEIRDHAAGYRTTATALGRVGALSMVTLWQTGAIAIAAAGLQADAWNWTVPTVLGVGSLVTNWLLAARADAAAVGLWWAASTVSLWLALA